MNFNVDVKRFVWYRWFGRFNEGLTTASGGVGDPGGVPQIYGAHFEGLSVVFAADYQGSDRGNHRSARPLSFGGIS